MERLEPHTLVKISSVEQVDTDEEIPEWVSTIFKVATYVIVRRGPQEGKIPVGIRGYEKYQRFAGWIAAKDIVKTITPGETVAYLNSVSGIRAKLPAFRVANKVIPLLKGYEWGIGGSLQFELATGLPMVKQSSDLDIIMQRPQTKMEISTAKELLESLKIIAGTHADIQIVNGQNGFSLEEYVQQRSSKMMMKTEHGPQLVMDPWEI